MFVIVLMVMGCGCRCLVDVPEQASRCFRPLGRNATWESRGRVVGVVGVVARPKGNELVGEIGEIGVVLVSV